MCAFQSVPFIKSQLNNRDHRKIMVVDGRVAYSGGINLSDEYINIGSKYGHWKDIGFKITGEGVKSYTYMFMEFWNAFSNDFIPHDLVGRALKKRARVATAMFCLIMIPYGGRKCEQHVFSEMLYAASDYVWFYTPYLILVTAFLTLL